MQQLTVIVLITAYVSVTCFANIAYKISVSGGTRVLIIWQVLANLVGIIGVVSLSWLYKLIPMHIAYPLTQAILIVAIQIVAARLIFREPITTWQWLGTGLIIAGIIMITIKTTG